MKCVGDGRRIFCSNAQAAETEACYGDKRANKLTGGHKDVIKQEER